MVSNLYSFYNQLPADCLLATLGFTDDPASLVFGEVTQSGHAAWPAASGNQRPAV